MTETADDLILLYITTKNKQEALSIARALLAEHLIACANILPNVTSVFEWDGAMQEEEEALLLAKTSNVKLEEAAARVKALHSYECPCIVSFALHTAHPPFADWIRKQIAHTT